MNYLVLVGLFGALGPLALANAIGNVVVSDEELRYCNEFKAMLETTMAKFNLTESPFLGTLYQCEKDGSFAPTQCNRNGICGCVNAYGNLIARTIFVPNRAQISCKGLKAGHCPLSKVADSCDMVCSSDAECPSNLKCCETDCGMTCVEPRQECYADEYACNDGLTCVPSFHICDGVPDCPNGDEELVCGTS
ncbi:whey acidic protein-like [Ptychodera flava]|uniref:whey acidic protein-like n=1 Tax=Ptychodera flava TaxID=63121 RepID=UPI00396A2CAD